MLSTQALYLQIEYNTTSIYNFATKSLLILYCTLQHLWYLCCLLYIYNIYNFAMKSLLNPYAWFDIYDTYAVYCISTISTTLLQNPYDIYDIYDIYSLYQDFQSLLM